MIADRDVMSSMPPPARVDASPVDVFDRRFDRRRSEAQRRLGLCLFAWIYFGGFIPIPALLSGHWDMGPGVFLITLAITAGVAGVTLRAWSVLPWRWRAAGLAPWVTLAMAATAGLLMRFA